MLCAVHVSSNFVFIEHDRDVYSIHIDIAYGVVAYTYLYGYIAVSQSHVANIFN